MEFVTEDLRNCLQVFVSGILLVLIYVRSARLTQEETPKDIFAHSPTHPLLQSLLFFMILQLLLVQYIPCHICYLPDKFTVITKYYIDRSHKFQLYYLLKE